MFRLFGAASPKEQIYIDFRYVKSIFVVHYSFSDELMIELSLDCVCDIRGIN